MLDTFCLISAENRKRGVAREISPLALGSSPIGGVPFPKKMPLATSFTSMLLLLLFPKNRLLFCQPYDRDNALHRSQTQYNAVFYNYSFYALILCVYLSTESSLSLTQGTTHPKMPLPGTQLKFQSARKRPQAWISSVWLFCHLHLKIYETAFRSLL
jgi:hypothetical protein